MRALMIRANEGKTQKEKKIAVESGSEQSRNVLDKANSTPTPVSAPFTSILFPLEVLWIAEQLMI